MLLTEGGRIDRGMSRCPQRRKERRRRMMKKKKQAPEEA
jgi:hypothetical protein